VRKIRPETVAWTTQLILCGWRPRRRSSATFHSSLCWCKALPRRGLTNSGGPEGPGVSQGHRANPSTLGLRWSVVNQGIACLRLGDATTNGGFEPPTRNHVGARSRREPMGRPLLRAHCRRSSGGGWPSILSVPTAQGGGSDSAPGSAGKDARASEKCVECGTSRFG
jgi:hypothetical protein